MPPMARQRLETAAEWACSRKAAIGVYTLVGAGVYGVGDALNAWIAVAVLIVSAGILFVRERTWNSVAVDVLRVPAAVLIAFLALAGFDVLINLLLGAIHLIPGAHHTRVPIWIGLAIALLLFGLVSYWYLRELGWKRWPKRIVVFGRQVPVRIGAAATLAFLVILAAPYVYGRFTADTDPVPASQPVASELDVRIVGDGRAHALSQLPPTPVLGEFDVGYSIGFAEGDRVRWTLVDGGGQSEALSAIAEGDRRPPISAEPTARAGADPLLLLLVDGTAPVVEEPAALPDMRPRPGEVGRWRRLATDAGAPGGATFALLQTSSRARIRAWKRFVPHGEAVSAQALGSRTATDAAVRLEVGSPSSEADFALAMAYRPVLLFDRREPVPWPLSVSALFNGEAVQLCHDQGVLKSGCDPVKRPGELESGGTHLQLKLPGSDELRELARRELSRQEVELETEAGNGEAGMPPAGTPPPGTVKVAGGAGTLPGAGTAIYVHPISVKRDHRELLYLDYWWYLPDNPVALGGGALCGAGLVIAGITCQNHESDWEGMTVIVDRTEAEPQVASVQYAQHDKVVSYGWALLRKRWDSEPKVAELVAKIGDASARPLAFVARGTHATYPTPCGNCFQVANPDVGEEPHHGNLAWVGDDTGACGRSSCLQMLPTHRGGRKPALWSAYDGTWGKHHCFLTYYCDSGTPPTAPGQQKRYLNPTHYDGFVGTDWRFHTGAPDNEGGHSR